MPTLDAAKLISTKTGESNAIPDSTWANSMRVSMENKNLLTKKGSIYVGSGNLNSVKDGDGNTQNIAQTAALETPNDANSNNPYFLRADGAGTYGISWQPLSLLKNGWAGNITISNWEAASSGDPGAYKYTIQQAAHGLPAGNYVPDYMVQVMQVSGSGNSQTYSLVSTSIDILYGGNVVIYSNVKVALRVLITKVG